MVAGCRTRPRLASTTCRLPRSETVREESDELGRLSRDESGAVAVFVAILAALLFALAGLAVDLGNAWARGRTVQKQADVSAISAGHLLPMEAGKAGHGPSDIAAEVAQRLNDNLLHRSAVGDGECAHQRQRSRRGGRLPNVRKAASCTTKCPRMTVVPPQAQVDFTFAAVMGFSNVQVQRPATVEVQSELPRKDYMMPFWLPNGCGYGPTHADSTGGSSGGPAAPAAYVMPRAAALARSRHIGRRGCGSTRPRARGRPHHRGECGQLRDRRRDDDPVGLLGLRCGGPVQEGDATRVPPRRAVVHRLLGPDNGRWRASVDAGGAW